MELELEHARILRVEGEPVARALMAERVRGEASKRGNLAA